jgi:hypothetical protein
MFKKRIETVAQSVFSRYIGGNKYIIKTGEKENTFSPKIYLGVNSTWHVKK